MGFVHGDCLGLRECLNGSHSVESTKAGSLHTSMWQVRLIVHRRTVDVNLEEPTRQSNAARFLSRKYALLQIRYSLRHPTPLCNLSSKQMRINQPRYHWLS